MKNRILKYIIYGLIIFVFMSLQSSNTLAILEINPDFLLIIVTLHSLHYGEYKGIIFGFFTGLLEDVFSGTLFGLNAFILTLISWLANVYKKYIFVADIIAFLIFIVIATVVKYICYILFNWLFKGSLLLDWIILLKMIGEIAYNAIVGIVLYYAAPLIYKKRENTF